MGACGGMSMAITYRMLGAFPGTVTRTHPQWIEPCKADTEGPPLAAGFAVQVNDTGDAVTQFTDGGDAGLNIYGVIVRAYPWQPFVVNVDGSFTPPVPVVDVIREGYVMVKASGSTVKDAPAYVAPDGTFSSASGAGPLKNARFNGPSDANGCAELVVTIPAGPHGS